MARSSRLLAARDRSYLAHDVRHDRHVAINVLHEDLGATLGPERFLAEIKTTAKLQHPHILPLLDSGEAGGLLGSGRTTSSFLRVIPRWTDQVRAKVAAVEDKN